MLLISRVEFGPDCGDVGLLLVVEPLNISPFRLSPVTTGFASPLWEIPDLTCTLPSPTDVSPQLLHSGVLWCSCCGHSQDTLLNVIVLNLNVALEVPEPQDESIVNIRDAPISLFLHIKKSTSTCSSVLTDTDSEYLIRPIRILGLL